jgi:hypothetical protein
MEKPPYLHRFGTERLSKKHQVVGAGFVYSLLVRRSISAKPAPTDILFVRNLLRVTR